MANESGQRRIDWETIEGEYRAGILSIRAIASRHGITHKAIQNRIKREGWQRDLSAKVKAQVKSLLIAHGVSEVAGDPHEDKAATEREIVDTAAQTVMHVVRNHRRDIAHGRSVVELLFMQLDDAASKRAQVQAEIVAETAGDAGQGRRASMFKAVSLPTHASTARDLAQALRHVIVLERQAFSLEDQPVEPPDPENTVSKKIAGQIVADLNAIATR